MLAKFFELLKEAYAASLEELGRITFDGSQVRNRTIIGLYATILEQTEASILLLEQGRFSSTFILQRTALEAYADQLNLMNDPDYIKYMEASFLNEWRKIFQEASTGTNPLMKKFSQNPTIPRALAEAKTQLATLKAMKIIPMKVFDKFKKAKLENEYRAVYGQLCSESHNNIRSLHERHALFENGAYHMAIKKEHNPLNELVLLDTIYPNLLNATYNTHSYYGTGAIARFQVLMDKRIALEPEIDAFKAAL